MENVCERIVETKTARIFDRGIVSEGNLAAIRKRGRQYLTGTPRGRMKQFEAERWQNPSGV